MADEGRMLTPEEARIRKKLADIKGYEESKTSLKLRKSGDSYKGSTFGFQRYQGEIVTKKRGQVQSVVGLGATYYPKSRNLEIHEMWPERVRGKRIPTSLQMELGKSHEFYGGTVLKPASIKQVLEKVARGFPKVQTITGARITGAHAKKGSTSLTATQQIINLGSLRKRMAKRTKIGKALGLGLAAYDLIRRTE